MLKVACITLGVLGLPAILVPDLLLSGFIHDAEVRAIATMPLRLVGLVMAAEAAGIIFLNALLGAGAARAVMTTSVATQWLIGLPAAWLAGPYLGYGLFAMWLMFSGYRDRPDRDPRCALGPRQLVVDSRFEVRPSSVIPAKAGSPVLPAVATSGTAENSMKS